MCQQVLVVISPAVRLVVYVLIATNAPKMELLEATDFISVGNYSQCWSGSRSSINCWFSWFVWAVRCLWPFFFGFIGRCPTVDFLATSLGGIWSNRSKAFVREVYKFLSSFQSSWVTACFLVLGSKELADPKGLASNGAELSVVSWEKPKLECRFPR